MFPARFSNLPAYAFPRLRALLDSHAPGGDVIHMTIGEPKHGFPAFVTDVIAANAAGFNSYPPNEGTPELRAAFCDWAGRRYGVSLDPELHVMPLERDSRGALQRGDGALPRDQAWAAADDPDARIRSTRSTWWRACRWGRSRSLSTPPRRRAICRTLRDFLRKRWIAQWRPMSARRPIRRARWRMRPTGRT